MDQRYSILFFALLCWGISAWLDLFGDVEIIKMEIWEDILVVVGSLAWIIFFIVQITNSIRKTKIEHEKKLLENK